MARTSWAPLPDSRNLFAAHVCAAGDMRAEPDEPRFQQSPAPISHRHRCAVGAGSTRWLDPAPRAIGYSGARGHRFSRKPARRTRGDAGSAAVAEVATASRAHKHASTHHQHWLAPCVGVAQGRPGGRGVASEANSQVGRRWARQLAMASAAHGHHHRAVTCSCAHKFMCVVVALRPHLRNARHLFNYGCTCAQPRPSDAPTY